MGSLEAHFIFSRILIVFVYPIFSKPFHDNYLTYSLTSHDTTEQQLRSFLPANDDDDDEDEVLSSLFGSDNFHFGNPVDRFKSDLAEGRLSPESQSSRRLFWRSERRNYREAIQQKTFLLEVWLEKGLEIPY